MARLAISGHAGGPSWLRLPRWLGWRNWKSRATSVPGWRGWPSRATWVDLDGLGGLVGEIDHLGPFRWTEIA
eukprot:1730409-Pyramimonas_sp.AAC.1